MKNIDDVELREIEEINIGLDARNGRAITKGHLFGWSDYKGEDIYTKG